MEESRTKNTIRNIKTGAIVQIINKLMAFAVRTVFIITLNTEYLGLNGLFTNVLTVLSLAELGIGTAIIYNMYKPIAENDTEKIKSLMHLYRKMYYIIGIIIFLLGLLVIPFMDFIVKDAPNIKENIILIYLLFLFNTASSYFFTYKKSIISAHQKQSIINNVDSIFYLVKSILEIIFLFVTKNFIVYLIIQISSTLLENIILSIIADRLYPYLKEKKVKKLSKKENKTIFSNIKSLMCYKVGSVIMNGTDNIIISALINITTVGLCANYTLVINSVKSIILSSLNGITASIGNLNVKGSSKKKEEVFYIMTLCNYLIFSFCAIAFIVLLNPFIEMWIGEKYLLPMSIVVAISLSFLIEGLRNPGYTYRIALGLFEKGKATPYIGAISNIILSILLCKIFGLAGIFIATCIAQLISYSWIDPYLIHKYHFDSSFRKYIKKYLKYAIIFTINVVITYNIAVLITVSGLLGFITKLFVIIIITNIINILFLKNSFEFKEFSKRIITPYKNKIFKKYMQ